jgi:hypothetical protein
MPAFILRNLNSVVAHEVTLKWKSEVSGIEDLSKSSSRLSKYDFSPGKILIHAPQDAKVASFIFYTSQSEEIKIPSIAKEAQVHLPLSLYPFAALYLAAKMPEKVGAMSEPFIFFVSIAWNFPVGAKEQDYRVKIMAINSKPSGITAGPEIAGFLNLEIERVN